MKKLLTLCMMGLLLACTNAIAQDLKFNEEIKKEFTVSDNSKLSIYNIFGSINVEGYEGNKVLIEVNKTLSAKSKTELEKGKAEFKLEFEQTTDGLEVYMLEPHDTRPNRSNKRWRDSRDIKYHYNLDFTVKVPYSLSLEISTVNNGDISITDVAGNLKVNNVNGAIAVEDAKGKVDVHTINGNVDVTYAALPKDGSDYYTLNGDMNITYPANLSADCEYKSFNGELFTDFPQVKMLPARISKNTEKDGKSTKYRLKSNTFFRIGQGGQNLHFETFNGNIYIRKQS